MGRKYVTFKHLQCTVCNATIEADPCIISKVLAAKRHVNTARIFDFVKGA